MLVLIHQGISAGMWGNWFKSCAKICGYAKRNHNLALELQTSGCTCKAILVSIFSSLCFKLIIMHYHTLPYPKTKGEKFKPSIKLSHDIYIGDTFETFLEIEGSLGFLNNKRVTGRLPLQQIIQNYFYSQVLSKTEKNVFLFKVQ